jgi:predicted metal-dependent phosphoesterase TrpH
MKAKLLRADLHTHTYYSPDALSSPGRFVSACLDRGIDCVAITDHNTIAGARLMERLCPFKVIVGEEIRTQEGEVIGLFLREEVPPGLTLEETVRRIKEQGGLVMVPHPFDRFRKGVGQEGLERILPYVDLIEVFNARTIMAADNKAAQRFAEAHGLPGVSVSDAHSPWEVGRSMVELPHFDGPESFLEALKDARLIARPSTPMVHLVSRWAALRRALGWRPLRG